MIQIFIEASKMCYIVTKEKQKIVITSCAGTIYDLVNPQAMLIKYSLLISL